MATTTPTPTPTHTPTTGSGAPAAGDWVSGFPRLVDRYYSLPYGQRSIVAELCERRAHDAVRAAVAAEPVRAIRVSMAPMGSCPWQYYDYVRVDIVPAKRRRGAVVRVVGGGAGRRYRSSEKALREGLARYPHRLSLGVGAWLRLTNYDGLLHFVSWLCRNGPDYCGRHPELAAVAEDLRTAMEVSEL